MGNSFRPLFLASLFASFFLAVPAFAQSGLPADTVHISCMTASYSSDTSWEVGALQATTVPLTKCKDSLTSEIYFAPNCTGDPIGFGTPFTTGERPFELKSLKIQKESVQDIRRVKQLRISGSTLIQSDTGEDYRLEAESSLADALVFTFNSAAQPLRIGTFAVTEHADEITIGSTGSVSMSPDGSLGLIAPSCNIFIN